MYLFWSYMFIIIVNCYALCSNSSRDYTILPLPSCHELLTRVQPCFYPCVSTSPLSSFYPCVSTSPLSSFYPCVSTLPLSSFYPCVSTSPLSSFYPCVSTSPLSSFYPCVSTCPRSFAIYPCFRPRLSFRLSLFLVNLYVSGLRPSLSDLFFGLAVLSATLVVCDLRLA